MPSPPQGYYAATAGPPSTRPILQHALRADVCVVGGGFTGLCAALHLAEKGAVVALVEAEAIGFAASGRNGGQIHTGLRKEQAELERWLGPVHAHDLWSLTEESKSLVRSLVARHAIACELKPGLVIAAHNARALAALADDTAYLARFYGYYAARMMDAEETRASLGTSIYPGARFDSGGGHLHPLKFVRGLAAAAEKAGTAIWEQSPAIALEPQDNHVIVHTHEGSITASRVILATDAFSGILVPELAPFIGHVESFVTATAPLPPDLAEAILPSDAAVADTRHVLDYYRKSADGRLLFAGRESYFRPPRDIAGLVRPRMLHVYPALESVPTEYAWSGTVGITRTRMPHFGRLGDRVLFAHGYSGQGVALACLGGKLMAEAALGEPERFDVFARVPAERFPGGESLRKPLIAAALAAYKVIDAL
ncbi:MAG TPA: FAD-binding oxidoreductase [Rhizomicrobium sp.]|nr:FAD-binding oxidoreductase [Rhizomicrobium sp.]